MSSEKNEAMQSIASTLEALVEKLEHIHASDTARAELDQFKERVFEFMLMMIRADGGTYGPVAFYAQRAVAFAHALEEECKRKLSDLDPLATMGRLPGQAEK